MSFKRILILIILTFVGNLKFTKSFNYTDFKLELNLNELSEADQKKAAEKFNETEETLKYGVTHLVEKLATGDFEFDRLNENSIIRPCRSRHFERSFRRHQLFGEIFAEQQI